MGVNFIQKAGGLREELEHLYRALKRRETGMVVLAPPRSGYRRQSPRWNPNSNYWGSECVADGTCQARRTVWT